MVGINLSNSMRFSLLSLKQTEISVEQTQLRLSTGLKVNSALDNPRNYYAANSLMNRAHDLNSLLDSMSQGIQTIKTSLQGLQTGEKLLKQASAVVAQACDVAPVILDKEWFENQKGVIAVVTSADELKSALASSKSGAIVVYGEIDMGNETITVDSGKKLVGVGYYADINSKATDANIEKFSKLTFDLKYDGVTEDRSPITLNSGASLSDLSVYAETDRMGTTFYTAGVIKCNGSNTISNADVSFDLSDAVKLSGLSGFAGIRGETSTVLNGSINIRNFTQGHPDYMIAGVCGGTVSIYGNSHLNISGTTRGITQGKFHVYDRAEINIEPGNNSYVQCGFSYGVVYLHSSESQINVFGNPVSYSQSFIIDSGVFTSIVSNKGTYYLDSNLPTTMNSLLNPTDGPGITIDASKKAVKPNDFMEPDDENQFPKYNQVNVDERMEQLTGYAQQYNGLLKAYDEVINDSSYKGVNLLQKDSLLIRFGDAKNSKLLIEGEDFSFRSLGLEQVVWDSLSSVVSSINKLEDAITTLREGVEKLGQNSSIIAVRSSFTENLINILTEGADKLTLADMNKESANMLALQLRQQLALNSLNLVSQSNQGILQLF